jgi:hypothetical protein
MMLAPSIVRHAYIPLGTIQVIVGSFNVLNTCMTWLEICFFIYIFRRADISVKKEASVNFLTDPQEKRLIVHPMNVMVHGWVRGKHVCVDLTGVSTPVTLGVGHFTLK